MPADDALGSGRRRRSGRRRGAGTPRGCARPGPRRVRSAIGCALTTREPGSGCVDSQLGMPRSLRASRRDSVSRKRGTPAGSHPAFDAYSIPSRSDSSSSSRSNLRNSRAEPGVGQVAERLHRGHEDADQQHRQRRPGRARVLLRHVPRGDVPHLVAEHAGQLGLVADVREQPAGDVDEAAGQGERVDGRRIEHGEGPGQVAGGARRWRSARRCRSRSAAGPRRGRRPSRAGSRRRRGARSRSLRPR